jgi:hypothetical protein
MALAVGKAHGAGLEPLLPGNGQAGGGVEPPAVENDSLFHVHIYLRKILNYEF